MINDYSLTIDVDWAPDWAIAKVADVLSKRKVKATWFTTHDSDEIHKIEQNRQLFEVGLHPNFAMGSSQGNSPEEVMQYMKSLFPEAKTIRSHSLIQSNALLRMIREEFDLLYDVSLFLPETPYIIPHEAFFSDTNKPLLRLPFFWEDDREMYKPRPCFSFSNEKYQAIGLKIFCFHVIHIILNSCDMQIYNKCKKEKDLQTLSYHDLEWYINHGKGTNTLFTEMLDFIHTIGNSGRTITELANMWRLIR